MFKNKLSTLFLALLFTGCAAQHVVPDREYVKGFDKNNNRFVVAFDQNGHIYPVSTDDENLAQTGLDWERVNSKLTKNSAMQLKLIEKNGYQGAYYNEEARQKINQALAKDIAQALEGNKKLFIYIHGFNNSYDEAKKNLKKLEGIVGDNKDNVTLHVVWDGLSKVGLNKYSWQKALTYSNLAGQIGLRSLLQEIKQSVDVVFVTHSRGAAVAMSTIFDPLYDSHIQRDQSKPLTSEHVKSINMLMLAPAIGNGHLVYDVLATKDKEIETMRIFSVANQKDRPTCKFVAPKLWGDSSLGCGKRTNYMDEVKVALDKHNIIYNYDTINLKSVAGEKYSHGITTYLSAPETQKVIEQFLSTINK